MRRDTVGFGAVLARMVALAFAFLPGPASAGPQALEGTIWQLVQFMGGGDTKLTPEDGSKYVFDFGKDSALSARIDCNRGRGTWTSEGESDLTFGPLALTRAMCPPGSLHDRIVNDLPYVRSYVMKDGHLFLSLMADAGIYEFKPAAGK